MAFQSTSDMTVTAGQSESPASLNIVSDHNDLTQQNIADLPKPSSTRNFSRKLYTPEPLNSLKEEVTNLNTSTTDLSFIKLSTPEPLTLITTDHLVAEQSVHNPANSNSRTVSARPSSRARHVSQQSTPRSSTVLSTSNHKARPSVPRSILESFFSPYAAPGPEEYPQPEDFEMERSISYTRSPVAPASITNELQRQVPAANTTTTFASTMGEKLGWLRSRAFSNVATGAVSVKTTSSHTAIQQRREDSELNAADPLFSLDISSCLFPSGPADPLDPSSFHTLLENATSLIETLQNAYKARTTALNDIRAEYAAQVDELDESETRSRHLKMQLSDMSFRMADTETSLRGQLLEERKRREELESKEKERTTRRRANSGVPSNASDSGFESDVDVEHSISSLDSPKGFDKTCIDSKINAMRRQQRNSFSELAMENYMLHERVLELEGAVDACLQLI